MTRRFEIQSCYIVTFYKGDLKLFKETENLQEHNISPHEQYSLGIRATFCF